MCDDRELEQNDRAGLLDALRPPALANLTLENAREILVKLGEQAPAKATRKQIRKEIHEVLAKDEPMFQFIADLHRQTEDELIETCKKREIETFSNDTVRTLRKKIYDHEREVCEPGPQDFVDFGQYRDLRYWQMEDLPEYVEWVLNMAASGNGDTKVMRLAKFLRRKSNTGPPGQMAASSSLSEPMRRTPKKETESGDQGPAVSRDDAGAAGADHGTARAA
jgi:hypothetical protein